jgi:hypothetical protein
MSRKSRIGNRSSKIWHLTNAENAAGDAVISDYRWPMPDFKIPNL